MITSWIKVSTSEIIAFQLFLIQISSSSLETIIIDQKQIYEIIKNLNIKAPLRIILENIVNTGIFPYLRNCANVTHAHKKDSKHVVKNYRPISLLFLPTFSKGYYF